MCGLSGQLSLDGSAVDRALVRRMMRCLLHRGRDAGADYFTDDISIGHRCLSIIDRAGGAQPMLSDSGALCLVSNGETLQLCRVAAGTVVAGVEIRTESDTEVSLKLLERHGPTALGASRRDVCIRLVGQRIL